MTTDWQAKLKARIDARKAAEAEAEAVLSLIAETATRIAVSGNGGLCHKEASRRFLEVVDATVHKVLYGDEVKSAIEAKAMKQSSKQPPKPLPPDVKDALEVCDEIESLADEIPSAGADFAHDVLEKTRSIRGTIERSRSVTTNQMVALENMCSGMARWIRD